MHWDSTKVHNNKRYHSFTPPLVKKEDTRKGLQQLNILEEWYPTRPAECSTIKCFRLFVKIKPHWPFGAVGSVTVIGKHNPLAHCLSKSSTVCPLSPPISSLLSLQILWTPHRPHSHSPSLPYPSSQRPSSLSILTSIPFHSFGITPSIKPKSDYRQIFADNTTRSLWDPTSNRRNHFYIIKITLLIKVTVCIPFQSD